jgi:hypothetical protein
MLLVLETITWKPHIETAMEIALRRRDEGEAVLYCNLRRGLPVCEDRSRLHALVHLPETRIRRAAGLLEREGIPFRRAEYSAAERDYAGARAASMLAGCRGIDDVRALAFEDFKDIGWALISSAISVTKDARLELGAHRSLLREFCQSAIMVYQKSRALLQEVQPDEALVFNGRFATTRAALRAAQSLGVPWKIHERGGDKTRFLVTDVPPHDLDRMQGLMQANWREESAEAGHEFFQGRRNRVERAWHSFTKLQEFGRLPAEMAEGEWVSFFTTSEDEMVAIGDELVNHEFPTQKSAVSTLAEAVARVPGLRLCVRVHPHVALKSERERRSWREFQLPGVLVLGPEDPTDSYALIERSRVVACYGSTVGIEATYWGRPSLLFARSYYDRLGVTTRAESAAQVEAFLRSPVSMPRSATLPYGAFWVRLGEPYRYYDADGLHRGSILGTYLDDTPAVRAAKRLRDGLLRFKPGRRAR